MSISAFCRIGVQGLCSSVQACIVLFMLPASATGALVLELDGIHQLRYDLRQPYASFEQGTSSYSPVEQLPHLTTDLGLIDQLSSTRFAFFGATIGSETGEKLIHRIEGNPGVNREHRTQVSAGMHFPRLFTSLAGGMRHDGAYDSRYLQHKNAYNSGFGRGPAFANHGSYGLEEFFFGTAQYNSNRLKSSTTVFNFNHWSQTPVIRSPLYRSGWYLLTRNTFTLSQAGVVQADLEAGRHSAYPFAQEAVETDLYRGRLGWQRAISPALSLNAAVHSNNDAPDAHHLDVGVGGDTSNWLYWQINAGVYSNLQPVVSAKARLQLPAQITISTTVNREFSPGRYPLSFLDGADTVHYTGSDFDALRFFVGTEKTIGDRPATLTGGLFLRGSNKLLFDSYDSFDRPHRLSQRASKGSMCAGATLAAQTRWRRGSVRLDAAIQHSVAGQSEPLWIPWLLGVSTAWGTVSDSLPSAGLELQISGPLTLSYFESTFNALRSSSLDSREKVTLWASVPFVSPVFAGNLHPSFKAQGTIYSLAHPASRVRAHPFGSIMGPGVQLALDIRLSR